MNLRTHVWGILVTGVLVLVLAGTGVAVLRPLPCRAGSRLAEVQRIAEARELGMIGDAEATAALEKLAWAEAGLGESHPVDPQGRDAYAAVHDAAIRALAPIKTDEALAVLSELALDENRARALTAIDAIRRRRERAAVPALMAVLAAEDARHRRVQDNDATMTLRALRGLREIADATVVLELRRFAQTGPREFDADIQRTIRLIDADLNRAADPEQLVESLPTGKGLLTPNTDRLESPTLNDLSGR